MRLLSAGRAFGVPPAATRSSYNQRLNLFDGFGLVPAQDPLELGLDPIEQLELPKRIDFLRVAPSCVQLFVVRFSALMDLAGKVSQLYVEVTQFGCGAVRLCLAGAAAFGTTAGAWPGYARPAARIGLAHAGQFARLAAAQFHDCIIADGTKWRRPKARGDGVCDRLVMGPASGIKCVDCGAPRRAVGEASTPPGRAVPARHPEDLR